MRCIRVMAMSIAAAVAMTACQTSPRSSDDAGARVPQIAEVGSRAFEYRSLADLGSHASAVVVAKPTGETFAKPFPYGGPDAAPTVYVRMRVTKVVAGATSSTEVDVVTPGDDVATKKPALLTAAEYLLFLTPAMYARDDPAGGYAIVGGPAGTYAQHGPAGQFVRVDSESLSLPASITLGATAIPRITKSERQLLGEGPH